MRAKIVFLQLLVFFILIISANAFSQPVDLKIEYHDFIYAYSGDYVNIVGKLTNTGDINYKDISITVKFYDKDNQLISREKVVVPYILSKENRYFKKITFEKDSSLPNIASIVIVKLNNGNEYKKEIIYPKGNRVYNPIIKEELLEKFYRLLSNSANPISDSVAKLIIDAIDNIEKVEDVEKEIILPLV